MTDMIDEGKHVDPGDAIDLLYKWLSIDTDMGIDVRKAEDLIPETKALLGVEERGGIR